MFSGGSPKKRETQVSSTRNLRTGPEKSALTPWCLRLHLVLHDLRPRRFGEGFQGGLGIVCLDHPGL